MQAVTTGAYRAVEFIKKNIRLEGVEKASVEDSKKVVEICTKYAQKGMFNIFLAVFFVTLAFAFVEPFFFIGYLISIAISGLYQAMFMANAGGAWDNAKKIVEVELKQKGTPLHDATVVGDTVGDPFKDTSSVAMNPIIKFTTLFGLLAVELAVQLTAHERHGVRAHSGGHLLRDFVHLRVAVVLRHADRKDSVELHRSSKNAIPCGMAFFLLDPYPRASNSLRLSSCPSPLFASFSICSAFLITSSEMMFSFVLSTYCFNSVARSSSLSVSFLMSCWRCSFCFFTISRLLLQRPRVFSVLLRADCRTRWHPASARDQRLAPPPTPNEATTGNTNAPASKILRKSFADHQESRNS